MSKGVGYLRLMRPINCFMMSLAVVVGAVLAAWSSLVEAWISIVYGLITGFVLTAASMTINDYYDREIDAINEPKRPIPSGLVKPAGALIFASILTIIGFLASYLTNTSCLVTAITAWLIFTTYTVFGKRSGLPGNFLVSACVAIPFVYGSIIATSEVRLNVLLFAAMAFLANTGREVTKGIVDKEGDMAQSVKTMAVRYGEKTAAITAAAFYVSAVVLSPIPVIFRLVSLWFIPFVVVTGIGLVASSFMLLKDSSRGNARKVKNSVLLWFIFGLLAYVAGVIG